MGRRRTWLNDAHSTTTASDNGSAERIGGAAVGEDLGEREEQTISRLPVHGVTGQGEEVVVQALQRALLSIGEKWLNNRR